MFPLIIGTWDHQFIVKEVSKSNHRAVQDSILLHLDDSPRDSIAFFILYSGYEVIIYPIKLRIM